MASQSGLKKEVERKPKVEFKAPDNWRDLEVGEATDKPEASRHRNAPSSTPLRDPGELSKQELEDLISGINSPPSDVEMDLEPPPARDIPTNILTMYQAIASVFQQAIEKSDFKALPTQLQRCNKFISEDNQSHGRSKAEYTFPQERILKIVEDIAEMLVMYGKATPGDQKVTQRYAKCRAQWRTDLDDDKMWDAIFGNMLPSELPASVT